MGTRGWNTFESSLTFGLDRDLKSDFEGEVTMNGMFEGSDSMIDEDLFLDDTEETDFAEGRRRAGDDDVDIFDDELDDSLDDDYEDDYEDEFDDEDEDFEDDFEDDDL